MRTLAQEPLVTRRADAARTAERGQHLLQPGVPRPVVHLQRTIGNQATQRLLRAKAGDAGIQAKLTVSSPTDIYEQEADRVAEQVMRAPEGALQTPAIDAPKVQRKCAACEEGGGTCRECAEDEEIQAKPSSVDRLPVQPRLALEMALEGDGDGRTRAGRPSTLSARINALRGTGRPLPEAIHHFFEPRFGVSFDRVRVHAHREAADLAHSLNARAFTLGRDLFFGSGQYAPDTTAGRKLLAHELTHVIQQGGAGERAEPAGSSLPLPKSPGASVMREDFKSTISVCHRVLTSRRFKVQNGGARIVLLLDELDEAIPGCGDFNFGVTLTKEVDWWADDEIGTCEASTGGARSFSFGNLSAGTYYLTIWRNFDHPHCCLTGDILVFDEKISSDSSGCARDKDPSAMDIVHGALDIAGFIPVLGAVPDGLNALIYAAEGDWVNAGISAVAMVPAFGDGAKLVVKGGKEVIEASGKTVFKLGEEGLAANLKRVKAEKAAKEVAETGSKEIAATGGREAAERAAKEEAEKAAKEAAEKKLNQKIAECEAVHAAYKALGSCLSCTPDDTPAERAAKIACITAVLAGRRKYLTEKCDYVLPGSIARGSALAERGHQQQVAQFVRMLEKCSTLPTK